MTADALVSGDEVVGRMQEAAQRLWSPTSFWHVGGLAWQAASIRDASSSVLVLRDESGPRGWGWVEDGCYLSALVAPDDADGADQVVAWFVDTAPAGSLEAAVAESSESMRKALQGAGFVADPGAPYSLDLRIDTAAAAAPNVPTGFAVRAMEPGEEPALVACHRASWRPHALPFRDDARPDFPPDAESSFSEPAFAAVRATWPYRDDLVVVAVAPDGTFAASCIAWLDEVNGVAEIEPLGVVPEHRGRGLGRAVCLEAVRLVGQLGGREVVIHPRGDDAYPAARALYASCGFRVAGRTVAYVRPAAPTS